MKHQYVGDINDYRKYALLRALSAGGANRIGVCWMLTPSDGRSDGNLLGYLKKPERYRQHDPELFDILAHAASEPGRRRLHTIEDSAAIPNAIYYNETLPDDEAKRMMFMRRCATAFADADLVFFDPDNGLEVSIQKGRKNSSKYVYLDELAAFYEAGKSLLIYQHFARINRKTFIASCVDRLGQVAPDAAIWVFTTANVAFFLLVHPGSPERLTNAATEACSRWEPDFINGQPIGGDAGAEPAG